MSSRIFTVSEASAATGISILDLTIAISRGELKSDRLHGYAVVAEGDLETFAQKVGSTLRNSQTDSGAKHELVALAEKRAAAVGVTPFTAEPDEHPLAGAARRRAEAAGQAPFEDRPGEHALVAIARRRAETAAKRGA